MGACRLAPGLPSRLQRNSFPRAREWPTRARSYALVADAQGTDLGQGDPDWQQSGAVGPSPGTLASSWDESLTRAALPATSHKKFSLQTTLATLFLATLP